MVGVLQGLVPYADFSGQKLDVGSAANDHGRWQKDLCTGFVLPVNCLSLVVMLRKCLVRSCPMHKWALLQLPLEGDGAAV